MKEKRCASCGGDCGRTAKTGCRYGVERIKPCPFCGSAVTVEGGGGREAAHILFFRCDSGCGAVVSFREATARELDAWNERAALRGGEG